MRLALIIAALILTGPGTAHAAPPPPADDGSYEWFSPDLTKSPVTVYVCTVPGACTAKGK